MKQMAVPIDIAKKFREDNLVVQCLLYKLQLQ